MQSELLYVCRSTFEDAAERRWIAVEWFVCGVGVGFLMFASLAGVFV